MIPWDLGSSSGSCNANEFPEIHRVSKIIRERMHSPLESVWAGDVQSLYVHCVPTAYVQAMRPGTCPLHRNSCDGKPQGGSKELRHTAAVGLPSGRVSNVSFVTTPRSGVHGHAWPAPVIDGPRLCSSWPAPTAFTSFRASPALGGAP